MLNSFNTVYVSFFMIIIYYLIFVILCIFLTLAIALSVIKWVILSFYLQ